ncbi:MAG: pyruvate, phosphate dikinase [Gemmatimonadales bacterium]
MTLAESVFPFGPRRAGVLPPIDLVGGKAWHLLRMAQADFPVPPGFAIGTELCRRYYASGEALPGDLGQILTAQLAGLEAATGSRLGGGRRPLLLSIRSGAAASMPGMLDTILNVGLSRASQSAMIRRTGLPRQFWDSYARLVRSFGTTVHGIADATFEEIGRAVVARHRVDAEHRLDTRGSVELATAYEGHYRERLGEPFPEDPATQIEQAIEAVLRSWRSPRAVHYRRLRSLPDDAGTAVIAQAMVFGNLGATSGTGVGFTRNPATGEPELYLDYLSNAQGEDLVSGRRTALGADGLRASAPALFERLAASARALEQELLDVQDFEFTVEEGRLWLLQTRPAKRTPWAAVRIAADLVREGLIDRDTARARLGELDLARVRRTRLDHEGIVTPIARGVPASPGVASGPLTCSPARAVSLAAAGRPPILVRRDTSTDALEGMVAAAGLLTAVGSRTSHAAVVARQLDRTCVVGCGDLVVDESARRCRLGGRELAEGELLTLDGATGSVYAGVLRSVEERPDRYLAELGLATGDRIGAARPLSLGR